MTKLVGGQAVIEGVMMRNGDNIAIAVRDPEKKIQVKKLKIHVPEFKIPIVRGMVNLVYMMYIGVKSLNYSSNVVLQEDGKKESPYLSVIILIVGLVLGVGLFKFLPLGIAELIDREFSINNYFYNIIDCVVKIIIFIGYIFLISKMKDIRRVFQYHGAEHKVVNTFESKEELNIENIKKYSTVHRRCGTTFIFLVLFIAIIIYMFIHPGLLIQKLTTKEPSDDQIEVAIRALKEVI